MAKKDIEETIEIPEGVTVKQENNKYLFKGPKGEVSRVFNDPNIKIKIQDNKLILKSKKVSKKQKALINTFIAHIRNLLTGVNQGYTYKLKVCSGHFPMNVSASNGKFIIKNFIGEKVPRTVELNSRVKVSINGDEVIVEGQDKDLVGQTAADIEQLTRRPGYDKRIFQDGIFIVEKAGKRLIK